MVFRHYSNSEAIKSIFKRKKKITNLKYYCTSPGKNYLEGKTKTWYGLYKKEMCSQKSCMLVYKNTLKIFHCTLLQSFFFYSLNAIIVIIFCRYAKSKVQR